MSRSPKEDRPPSFTAARWVHQITGISVEMVLPAVAGYWLDQRWGTTPWLTAGGAVLGFAVAMLHLVQLAAGGKKPPPRDGGQR